MATETKAVPMNATQDEMARLTHDNVKIGNYGMMVDAGQDLVVIDEWTPRRDGRGADETQSFKCDRKTFNKFIKWYTEGIVPREDKREVEETQ